MCIYDKNAKRVFKRDAKLDSLLNTSVTLAEGSVFVTKVWKIKLHLLI